MKQLSEKIDDIVPNFDCKIIDFHEKYIELEKFKLGKTAVVYCSN